MGDNFMQDGCGQPAGRGPPTFVGGSGFKDALVFRTSAGVLTGKPM
ncbi:Uncharacterized protein pbN1_00670 [Aromatoleum bremense]|nr:Uncharacterized protein pbN1_00670 [Aromatoleum bremense]